MNFGEFLEKELASKEISKSEFARKLGITRQSLCGNMELWKSGREPNLSTIKKYREALGLAPKKFF